MAILLYLIYNFLLHVNNFAYFISWLVYNFVGFLIDIFSLEIIWRKGSLYIADRTTYKHCRYLGYQFAYVSHNIRRLNVFSTLRSIHDVVYNLAFFD